MIGCIALTAFLALLAFKLVSHRRACAAGGPGNCGGPPWARRWGRGSHRGWGDPVGGGHRREFLWSTLAALDLTPAQDKVVRAEISRVKDRARVLRDEAGPSRADVARAVRGDDLDETALADMFVRHDDRMRELREDVAGALGRIHAALDPEQRARLADLIEAGPRRGGPRGPYR